MKKIGFIALALVTLFATLGVGFSMWSQTINITGNVDTGNVSLSTSNYSGSWAYKVLNPTLAADSETVGVPAPSMYGEGTQLFPNDLIWAKGLGYAGSEIKPVGAAANPGNYLNVGYAEWTSISNGGLNLAATWHNIFPVLVPTALQPPQFKYWAVDFDVTNSGTIPTKFVVNIGGITPTATNGVEPAISVVYSYVNSAGATVTPTTIEGLQLEPGQHAHVAIRIAVDEETAQSYNGSFTATIVGEQWNEYVPPTPTTPTG